jgi:hypothetical protein
MQSEELPCSQRSVVLTALHRRFMVLIASVLIVPEVEG